MSYNLTTTDRTVLYDKLDTYMVLLIVYKPFRLFFLIPFHNIIFFTKISNYCVICKCAYCVNK